MRDKSKKNINKKHISSHQFFVLFCLCFFSPSMIFLPKLMAQHAGNVAWIASILGGAFFVILFFLMRQIARAKGLGFAEKSQDILGKPLGTVLTCIVMVWCAVLSAFFVRHFAERVLLVYLGDASIIFVVLSTMLVVLLALLGGMLSYARLCEMLFYFFAVLFLGVTIMAMFDGMHVDNILPFDVQADTGGVFKSSLLMFFPFSIVVFMTFFADRVNFDNNKLFKQGIKASVIVCVCTTLVLVLTLGRIGVFGVEYLQLPYFSLTRQVSFLGPLKNIGSIVFSLWILADFGVVATLCYTSASIGQRFLHYKHRTIPVFVVVVFVAALAILGWQDMQAMDLFVKNVVVPCSIFASVGLVCVLFVVGLIRGKLKDEQENKDSYVINL